MINLSLLHLLLASFHLVDGGISAMNINQDIHLAHQRVIDAKNEDERVIEMRKLVSMLSDSSRHNVALIDDEAVGKIAALLETNGDVGRFYGARALSAIACRASVALPALQRALSQASPVESDFYPLILSPSVSPYEEIERAIMRIELAKTCSDEPAR